MEQKIESEPNNSGLFWKAESSTVIFGIYPRKTYGFESNEIK